jgi:glutaminase
MSATMYDQGEEALINMGLWLKTSALGGGLVALEPA